MREKISSRYKGRTRRLREHAKSALRRVKRCRQMLMRSSLTMTAFVRCVTRHHASNALYARSNQVHRRAAEQIGRRPHSRSRHHATFQHVTRWAATKIFEIIQRLNRCTLGCRTLVGSTEQTPACAEHDAQAICARAEYGKRTMPHVRPAPSLHQRSGCRCACSGATRITKSDCRCLKLGHSRSQVILNHAHAMTMTDTISPIIDFTRSRARQVFLSDSATGFPSPANEASTDARLVARPAIAAKSGAAAQCQGRTSWFMRHTRG